MAVKAPTVVIQEANVQDISTRSVDGLVTAITLSGLSKTACVASLRRDRRHGPHQGGGR